MKKIIITLVVALGLIGAVYGAAATLTVGGVDSLGANTVDVVVPGGTSLSVDDLSWTLVVGDTSLVSGVDLNVNSSDVNDPTVCEVSATVYDDNGGASPITNGSGTNASPTIVANDTTNAVAVAFGGNVSANAIEAVSVTITCS